MTNEVHYRIWAEQDETTSALMMQIGTDKPVCIAKYDRRVVKASRSAALIEIQSADDLGDYTGRPFVAILINGDPSELT